MTELEHILPGEPIPRGSLFHERRYRVALASTNIGDGGGFLLDIGCGNAAQTEFFARHFDRVIGIDLQVDRIPDFSRDLRERGIENIHLVGGISEWLPFRDGTFDCVTCFEVLEHVQDQAGTLGEIQKVLKPGGALIMSVPHRWWIFETHGADLPLLPWNRVPFFSWLPKSSHDRWARARIYRQAEIQKIIETAGFTSVQTKLLTAPMDVVKNPILQKLLRGLVFKGDITSLPPLASTIFVCAKKMQKPVE